MFVTLLSTENSNSEPKRAKVDIQPALSFLDEDKIGTIQPHDDTLVVMLRIGGYDVKRVMVDQDSGVEIMYPDLYKGLNLRLEDLTAYDYPLVSFDGKVVIPMGKLDYLCKLVQKWWSWTSSWWTLIPPTRPLWPDHGFMP